MELYKLVFNFNFFAVAARASEVCVEDKVFVIFLGCDDYS